MNISSVPIEDHKRYISGKSDNFTCSMYGEVENVSANQSISKVKPSDKELRLIVKHDF